MSTIICFLWQTIQKKIGSGYCVKFTPHSFEKSSDWIFMAQFPLKYSLTYPTLSNQVILLCYVTDIWYSYLPIGQKFGNNNKLNNTINIKIIYILRVVIFFSLFIALESFLKQLKCQLVTSFFLTSFNQFQLPSFAGFEPWYLELEAGTWTALPRHI